MLIVSAGMAKGETVATVTVGGTTTEYASLGDAFRAANVAEAEPVMKLTFGAASQSVMGSIDIRRSMVLDLNGKTLNGSALKFFNVRNSQLTVRDSGTKGSIRLSVPNVPAPTATAVVSLYGGALLMESGTLLNNTPYDSTCCVIAENKSRVVMAGGMLRSINTDAKSPTICVLAKGEGTTVDIKDGTVQSRAMRQYSYGVLLDKGPQLTMTGGLIQMLVVDDAYSQSNRYNYGIMNREGKAAISGGTISVTARSDSYALYASNAKAVFDVTGGQFLVDVVSDNGIINRITSDNIRFSAGDFSSKLNMKDYMVKGRYVVEVPMTDSRYDEGYLFTVADSPQFVFVRNMTQKTAYETLKEAMEDAVQGDVLMLVSDYELDQNLTIKKGVRVVVPHNAKNETNGAYPLSIDASTSSPMPYRTLTIAEGVKLTVEGELELAGLMVSPHGGTWHGTGVPYGKYSFVKLGRNAQIDVKGQMYCWGYVAGKGTVTVENGATLYEPFVVVDWQGGTRTSGAYKKAFPYNQYYVQAVESKVVFMPGAKGLCATDFNAEGEVHPVYDFSYITADKGFFQTGNKTKITRQYDGTTDRVSYTFEGDCKLGNINMTVGGYELDSRIDGYCLPIPNNYTLNVKSGTFTILNATYMTPGSVMNIAKDATVVADSTLFLMDRKDWKLYGGPSYVAPLAYTVANETDNRTVRWGTNGTGAMDETLRTATSYERMGNCRLNIDGTLRLKERFQASPSSAEIVSENGTGRICYDFPQVVNEKKDTCYFMEFRLAKAVGERMYPVKLQNSASKTLSTLGVGSNTTLYSNGAGWAFVGDLDGDGRVTMSEANAIANCALGKSTLPLRTADVDGDGKITLNDAKRAVSTFVRLNKD